MANTQLAKTLDAFLDNSATMPQAYLFLGLSALGTSSRQLVDNFATKITGKQSSNMDVVVYDASVESGIDALRQALQLASLMPAQAKHKVVVMLNMHNANVQMQNALLKSLEEPPARTVFLLLSALPMLPTIMSRCQVFTVPRIAGEEEVSDELMEAMQKLEKNTVSGLTEKIVLVNELAELDDALLPKLIEHWVYKLVGELKGAPQKYIAVRASLQTLEDLRGNFNKKMVLQKFVTNGLA